MELTARLLQAMTDPTAQDEEFRTWYPDLSALSEQDLGTLVPAAYAVGREAPFVSMSVRLRIEDEAKQRQPRYTPEACERMFQSLVDGLAQRKWADLVLGTGTLVRCTGPWPDLSRPARTLAEFFLVHDRLDQPFALLAIAGLAGDDILRAVDRRLRQKWKGPIVHDELDTVVRLAPVERVLLAQVADSRSFNSPPVPSEVWERIAAVPACAEFARRALEAAAERARAVQEGRSRSARTARSPATRSPPWGSLRASRCCATSRGCPPCSTGSCPASRWPRRRRRRCRPRRCCTSSSGPRRSSRRPSWSPRSGPSAGTSGTPGCPSSSTRCSRRSRRPSPSGPRSRCASPISASGPAASCAGNSAATRPLSRSPRAGPS
ncbi:hypothetical protein ACFQY7_21535 [Actinomadura luteofluorescens]|uniref:hypothetical protein n=1 Tax=Actinomadura luteofluorescens TaxID=46163 RepID=UPI0036352C5D